MVDDEGLARFMVGAFRSHATRVGAADRVASLVRELSARSPQFAALWAEHDVEVPGDGVKHLHHPLLGPIRCEYSTLAVEERPDLQLVVFNPVTPADQQRVAQLISAMTAPPSEDVS